MWIEASVLRVTVFGGGKVGTRRALKFHDAGAEVYVVSLGFSKDLLEAARRSPRLHLVEADADSYVSERLVRNSDIVVIAVDNAEARRAIWRFARTYRKLVNDATDADATHIVVPYEANVAGIRVAVTTEGKSGVTARHALSKIVRLLSEDEELRTMLEALAWAKKYMKSVIPDAKTRFPIYFEIEKNEEFMRAVREGDVERAKMVAKSVIDSHVERLARMEERK